MVTYTPNQPGGMDRQSYRELQRISMALKDVHTKEEADALYLTIDDAASTYLTTASANSTYLKISTAASTYLTIANAASTYLTIANAASTYLPTSGGTMTGLLTMKDPGDVTEAIADAGNGARRFRIQHSASGAANYIGFVPRNSGDTGFLWASRLAWDVGLQKWCIGTDYLATKASLSSLVDAFQSAGAITAGQATTIKATL